MSLSLAGLSCAGGGGYEHLSHAVTYHRDGDPVEVQAAVGHPDCLDLLAHLRAEWAGRYVLAFHKHRCLDAGNAERESQPYEDLPWDAPHIRLLTPHAKADPLYRKFRLAHDLDHADYLLQSCIMSQEEIEQLVGMADGVIGRRPLGALPAAAAQLRSAQVC